MTNETARPARAVPRLSLPEAARRYPELGPAHRLKERVKSGEVTGVVVGHDRGKRYFVDVESIERWLEENSRPAAEAS